MRHSKLTGLMLSVVMVVGLWAVSSTLADEKPRRGGGGGGILNAALAGDPPSLDMHQEQTFMVAQPMGPIYNNLIVFDPHNYPQIIGDLAKSWTVSDDYLTYTFTLHEGVKFHDGSELTSADVKASWDRMVFPPEGVVSPRRSNYPMIKSIERSGSLDRSLPPAPPLAVVPDQSGPPGQLYLCQKISRSGCPLL